VSNPHQITKDFERALCEYTGAPYAVAVTSCTMALLLAVAWHIKPWNLPIEIDIPRRTYVGVPQSIIHAGGRPTFRDEFWVGTYQLKPLPVWDSARWFTSGMYVAGQMQCVSFHSTKTLGDTQGGAILHDDPRADAWLRRARFDGRTEGVAPKDDTFDMVGWHAYLSPDVSARLLWKLSALPKHNTPIGWDQYPDLSQHPAFQ
jgi:dTDP-4-amino-4,6-dideoxygalactose transaminase